jgi:hypothetical protein
MYGWEQIAGWFGGGSNFVIGGAGATAQLNVGDYTVGSCIVSCDNWSYQVNDPFALGAWDISFGTGMPIGGTYPGQVQLVDADDDGLPDFDVLGPPVGLGEDSAWGYSNDWSLTLGEDQYGDIGAIVTNLSHQQVEFKVTGQIVGTDITDSATGTLSHYGDQTFSELFDEAGPIQGPATVAIGVTNLTPGSQIFAGVGGVQIFGN